MPWHVDWICLRFAYFFFLIWLLEDSINREDGSEKKTPVSSVSSRLVTSLKTGKVEKYSKSKDDQFDISPFPLSSFFYSSIYFRTMRSSWDATRAKATIFFFFSLFEVIWCCFGSFCILIKWMEFERLETTYWSKVAKHNIENGKQTLDKDKEI